MIRTQTAIALVSALMLVLAGCASGVGPAPTSGADTTATNDADVDAGDSGGGGGDGTAAEGSSEISFYLSDMPSAIDDFEHLNVTITKVGFHRVESAETERDATTANETTTAATTNETPTEPTATERPTATPTATATLTAEPEDGEEADDRDDDREHENETEQDQDREEDQEQEQDGDGEWVTHDVNDTTVDLTELQGANATKLDVLEVAPGTYDKVFIYVGEIDATLKNGEQVRVKLPSERLHVNKQLTVGDGDATDFVFDVSVFKAGKSGKYILKPVVSQTGTGDEVEIDPVDDDEERKGGNGSDEKNPEDERDGDGNESEAGELAADIRGPVKSGTSITLAVIRDGDPVANATVEANGERAGTTDADGTIEVDVPQDAGALEIAVTKGEAELEIERTIRGGGGNGGE